MSTLEIKLKNDHGKVTLINGNGRTRLKRKKTGRVGEKVKKSKK